MSSPRRIAIEYVVFTMWKVIGIYDNYHDAYQAYKSTPKARMRSREVSA